MADENPVPNETEKTVPNEQPNNEPENKPVEKETLPSIDKNKDYKGSDVLKLVALASKNTATNLKNQLYPEIERQKAKMAELEASIKGATEKEKEQIMAEKAEIEKKNKELEEQLNKVNEQLKAVADKTKEIETKSTEKEISEYKQRLIDANKGKIVEELVTGKTKEELDASLAVAKSKYTAMEEEFRTKLNLPKALTAEELAKQNEPVNINRINTTNAKDINDYRKSRNAIREEVYRKEGFPI